MADKVELTEEQKAERAKQNKGCLKGFGILFLVGVGIIVFAFIFMQIKYALESPEETKERLKQDSIQVAIEKENVKIEAQNKVIEQQNKEYAKKNSDKATAITMAEKFVLKSLKAPATAKFCGVEDYSANNIYTGEWEVTGWVDSQNSFGAMLRTNFVITVAFDLATDSWSVKSFSNK